MILPLLVFAQIGCPIKGVEFHASITPKTAYVGQQMSYDAAIQMNVYAQTSFQSNPEYTPPDVRSATTYDFPFDTASIHDVKTSSGLEFRQFLYHRALFPLQAGQFTIPSAALNYSLPDENDPYAPPKHYACKADSVRYTVVPVPDAGKPADFMGAVGQYKAKASIDAKAPRVGETFLLTLTLDATGNVDLAPRPPIETTLSWATVTKSTEHSKWDSVGTMVHGTKDFEWLVSPTKVGKLTIPQLRYAYFDPNTKQYAVAFTDSIPITVAPGINGAGLVQKHDSVGTSPFPTILQSLRDHIVMVIVIVLVVMVVIAGIVAFARTQEPID